MNRSAIGFTAAPEYPPMMDLPCTEGSADSVSISTPVMELIVLIAAMPSAPPRFAARAIGTMSVMFGVSFASTGSEVPFFAARVKRSISSSDCPIVTPRSSDSILGQEKLHSITEAPAFSHFAASSVHSSSFLPMMEAMMTLVGNSCLSLWNTRMFSSTL